MPLLTILVGLVLALGILLVFVGVAQSMPADAVQARLTQLGTMQAKSLEELELQQPIFDRTVRPIAQRLSGIGRRLTSATQAGRTEQRLAMAGHPGGMRTSDFLGFKIVIALAAAAVAFLVFALIEGNVLLGALLAILAGGVGYMAPEFWIGRRVRARQHQIVLSLPDALDLLTISVRAGLGFDAALAKVTEKLPGPLSDEFRRALAEVRVGKQRREALRDIVARTEVPALTNFIGAVIQAEQLGVSISKVLQVQSEQLRIERRQRAEQAAAQAPIKMLFPLVGCIFPSLFVVILGPALILISLNLGGAAGAGGVP
ncbi:MAG: type II secretion system F family protein [Candidatus Limnocylindrales bacterium]